MKAWRKKAEAINARKAAGSKEPSARVQMQQARFVERMFKPKGSGNWLLDGLLLKGGFKAAVYGDIVNLHPKTTAEEYAARIYDRETESLNLQRSGKSWLNSVIAKTKAWRNS